MEAPQVRNSRRYPLHVTIAFVFSGLFLLVGLTLISYNYYEIRKMTLLDADRFMAGAAEQIETTVSDLYRPMRALVDVYSRALTAEDTSVSERLEALSFLVEGVRVVPNASAVFVGYEDGDFFLVRDLERAERSDSGIEAPEGASYLVQSLDHEEDGASREVRLFFDDALDPVGEMQANDTGFDPRERAWYREAMAADGETITSDFYVFFTTRRTGLTVARTLDGGGGVVGADLALADLESALAGRKLTPSTRIAVLDRAGGVIALSDLGDEIPLAVADYRERIEMPRLAAMDDPLYREIGERFVAGVALGREVLESAGREWAVSTTRISEIPEGEVYLAVAVPMDELLAVARQVQINGALISLVFLAAAVAVVFGVSRNISRSLARLADEAERVREFELESPVTVRSRIREVDDLAQTMALMKSSLQRFLDISKALSAEKDYRRVLEMVVTETINVASADAGTVLMLSEDHSALEVALVSDCHGKVLYGGDGEEETQFDHVRLDPTEGPVGVEVATALEARVIGLDDIEVESGFDTASLRNRFDQSGFSTASVLSVPLQNQADEAIGVLQLVRGRESGAPGTTGFRPEMVSYIEALAADAAVALDIRRLLKAQRDLLDSLILMIAGAIDAKSPYTSGHCQRVPVVARILAEAADRATEGSFADFRLSPEQEYQLHLASWLHDCGKVTTPEYVVDKATKLETIYNRIHEIRMRFEVLWRDAEIEYLSQISSGEGDEGQLRDRLEERRQEIRRDFEFVASCNLGDEPMTEDKLERLGRVAAQTWIRNLDKRRGLSHVELEMFFDSEAATPAVEPLLADKPEHIIPRLPGQDPFGEDDHGFRMEVPEHQYNRGEIYNLSIARGTLTEEERFKINEHAIQTIRMLDRLPFPSELRQVPAWAGNHHEKLDGTGYPRRLAAEQLSTPERIMAMADIFEALTARDRPYHPARSMSQALGVMSAMCSEGHLCPDLFELFVRSGAYLEYGHEYLDPGQIDEVDVEALMAGVGR